MDRRNPSPENSNGRRPDKAGEQSQDTPSPNRLQELRNYHLRTTNLYSGQVSTNEASISGSDRQSARQSIDQEKQELESSNRTLQSEREKSENIDLKRRIERVQQEGQSQQREIQELRSENQTLRQMFQQKDQAWQERMGNFEREIKKLQDQVRDLEQKNSQTVIQENLLK